ncbi:efflux RND transporter periplasmic adaptor subunit [Limisphaera ngatamarikiensis]|uniref:Efflux RND transporter periplasmic adaptor subunit n=1 Tax=Limisphaera ngatamarikiensis TaxID=1324935 RepID=A0A6M1RSY2_9BACT|nr:efflux RND transporter periplasmic adaptor subunit [Limisphaera ngatamarikiensis]NGO38461.1 efflux RND transporter periplasmic adaptor subunit [Limisphaera ngatamarikiensis]
MTETRPSSEERTRGPVWRRWRRWAFGLVVAGILATLLGIGLRPAAEPVEIGTVSRGAMEATLREEGKTRIKERYVISAPVAGNLRRIPLKAGDPVRAGETVLATLDPLPAALLDARARAMAEARRDAARAELERARAALDWARAEARRVRALFESGSATPQERDAALWRETDAAQQAAAAEHQLRMAEAELRLFTDAADASPTNSGPVQLRSPVDGRVLRVFETSARVVSPGTPLLEVGDPTDLEVVIEVLSREAVTLQPGLPVRLEQWGGETPLEARIRRVEPSAFTKVSALGVEEQRVRVIADLITPPERRPGLGDQFRVDAVVILWSADDVLKVPVGALFRRGSDWAVFVLDRGRARLRPVAVGHRNEREAEIRDGLHEGETVLLYPGERVRDGQRVRPVTINP